MKIKKILNNNAVVSNAKNNQYIFIGNGIGFNKKVGDEVDTSQINHKFVLEEKGITEKLVNLVQSIPIEYTQLTADIIDHAKEVLKVEFTDMLYVSLLDHVYNTVSLKNKGIVIHNKMFLELERLYPNVMEAAGWAVSLINDRLHTDLDRQESANIAMHIIASKKENGVSMDDLAKNTRKIHDIIELTRIMNHLDLSSDSMALDRFTIHLSFLLKRLDMGEKTSKDTESILEVVGKQYPQSLRTAKVIENYLGQDLPKSEILYLTLHVHRLIDDSKK